MAEITSGFVSLGNESQLALRNRPFDEPKHSIYVSKQEIEAMIFVITLLCLGIAGAADWSYEKTSKYSPDQWKKHFPECGGDRQSPVAFAAEDLVVNHSLPEFFFDRYRSLIPKGDVWVENNGHSFSISMSSKMEIDLFGGGLPTWYRLKGIHFHWSNEDDEGMEHMIGGELYPLVAHLVHLKEDRPINEVLNSSDGLAVIAIPFALVEGCEAGNKELHKITQRLKNVKFKGQKVDIEEDFDLMEMFPKSKSNFFRYEGSLTTPPCSEAVIWSVLTEPTEVSPLQLHQFRRLHSNNVGEPTELVTENFRPIQPLNGRRVQVRREVAIPGRGGKEVPGGPERKAGQVIVV